MPKRSERPAPEFSLTEKNLPSIKEWEVGKKYAIELNVEMVNHSKGGMFADTKQHEARFKILSVDCEKGADKSENVKS